MAIVSVEDLVVEFATEEGAFRAVDGVSFDIRPERTLAIVGESGSGKSVLSQAIMGILPEKATIPSGRILFDDPATDASPVDLAALPRVGPKMRAIRGNRIAMIFQEPMTSLSPLHTIGDQIGEAAKLHRDVSQAEARELTRDMLRLVQFPDPERALDAYAFELSGGLRQRAMIAMALICHPALLIADEPTTALDVTIQAEILSLINDIQDELKMAVLMITHDFGVVANVADDVVVVYRGKVMEAGSVEELFRNPQHDYLKALLNAVPRFHMEASDRLEPIRPIEAKPGGFLMQSAEEVSGQFQSTGPIVEVRNASKIFTMRKNGWFAGKPREIRALDNINLTIPRGECLGVVGESGSGKSTLAKAVLRAISLDEGSVTFDGGDGPKDIADFTDAELKAYRRQVQLVFQDPFSSLNPRMTVFDILSEPYVIHKLCGPDERAERIKELLKLVGLDVRAMRRYPHSFSGGQRQRIGIARSLALSPQLLLLDEPVSALDVSVQAQILNLLKDLRAELGLTYLFIGHNLAVVDYIADRIAVMCKGRLVELAPSQAVTEDPRHPYTRALMAAVPEPSLDYPLDFESLSANAASDPAAWPEPYRLTDDRRPALVEVAPNHYVAMPTEQALPPLEEAV